MHSVIALLALAGAAVAQTGYGRFPCTIVNGDGTFSADQTQCANNNLVAPGADMAGAQAKGDLPTPTNPTCVQELESGAYFCGIAGATCTTTANCDNGICTGGICQGGFTQACGGVDANCSGYLGCLAGDFSTTTSGTCGGLGAYCQDPVAADPSLGTAAAQPIYNQFCQSGYCSAGTGNCDVYAALGGDCSTDPDFQCGPNATCDTTTNPAAPVCVANVAPSGRARARRNDMHKRNLCPASHSACAVEGGSGFECIDTTSSLEQCGACANQGGVDCTAIAGAESVGCVAGVCEIWACAEGFEWNAASQSCTN